jgi:exosortase
MEDFPYPNPPVNPAVAPSLEIEPVATTSTAARGLPPAQWSLAGVLAGLGLWSYWPVFDEMAQKWLHDPQYSHGYLVPMFAAYLAWRAWSRTGPWEGSRSWWGGGLIAVGVAVRLAGARWYVDWLEAMSLLPMLAGSALLLIGWEGLRRLAPAIGFLAFMVPLPYRVETGLSQPLQRLATAGATYVLQTLGRPAFAEGNVIVINDARVGVVEACNGLGMFLLFFATAAAVILLVRRPLWQKAVIFLSAAPIAVGVNVARIVATALVTEGLGEHWFNAVFHDLSGWLMMPAALAALAVVVCILDRLIVEVEVPLKPRVHAGPAQVRSAVMSRPAPQPRSPRRHLPETTP